MAIAATIDISEANARGLNSKDPTTRKTNTAPESERISSVLTFYYFE